MEHRIDDDGGVWIQGGTAPIPAPGEPGGGPVVIDDTPPELKEHRKREEDRDARAFRANHTAQLYGDHYTKFAEAKKTMNLADSRGLTERSLKAFDADFLARAKAAPSDEARQGFVDDAMDLRRALETQFGMTESTFKDMERRSDLGLKADALSRQAQAYPEDYALHAAVLDKVADGAVPLVTRERITQFRRFEAEKMARIAMMGFIEQGRFDEGRALLATATDENGNPGTLPLPLPPEAVKELGDMLEQRHAEAAAREVRLDRVDTVIEGTAGPTDDPAEWQALVEEHYQVAGPQMAELEPAERIGAEDDYVRKLGHLPKPLTRSLRAGMLSGEPGQEAAAALRLKTLADHDPALIAAIPEAERARAAAIAEFAELGLKPERAVELGEEKLAEVGAEAETSQFPAVEGPADAGMNNGETGIPDTDSVEIAELPEGGGLRLSDPGTGSVKDVSPEEIAGLAELGDDLAEVISTDDPESLNDVPDELGDEIGEIVLGLVPGIGEALSAKEAYAAFLAARMALDDEDLSGALMKGGEAALAAIGAVPIIGGTVRFTKAGAKTASLLLRVLKAGRRQGRRVAEGVAVAGRTVSKTWFGRWTDKLLTRTVKAQGKMARVGTLSPKVRAFVEAKGKKPGTRGIIAVDRRLVRMVRDTKKADQKLAREVIRRMPDDLKNPRAVLWDKKKGNLVYVFDVPGTRKGKYVINVGFVQEVQRGDKLVRRQGNFVSSGGAVPRRILSDTNAYELVDGRI
jgi:hypothetical protein